MISPATPRSSQTPHNPKVRSIRRAFTQLLVLGISIPALLIWAVGQWTSGQAVTFLWQQLSGELASHTIETTLRYFETSETALSYNDAMFDLDLVDDEPGEKLLSYLLQGLHANPNAAWYTFATSEGAYLSAYRTKSGGISLTWREQTGDGAARYRDWAMAPDGSRTALPDTTKNFDPRKRDWYQNALTHTEPVWSKPFLFASGPPGFILSRAARDAQGTLRGVWAIEYEMGDVSAFLAGLKVGRTGRAYLLTQSGEVIGHPLVKEARGEADDLLVSETESGRGVSTALNNADIWLQRAFLARERMGDSAEELSFELEGSSYLVASKPFPEETGLPWLVLMVIPEDDILGSIHQSFFYAGLAAILVATLVLGIGIVYSHRRISRPLADIAKDLDSMAKLKIEEPPRITESRLAEVAGMVMARERLRSGLSNFQRYVPAQLVRDLLEQGVEARLGGQRRTLTMFFSDVVGFTKISEDLGSPQALVDLLGDYLEVLSSAISECNGTVDKYIGDAVMAFWGAPKPMSNHALAGVRAAWLCQSRLEELHRKWPESHPRFFTRIGMNTGEVIVGNVGWEKRMNYTVMGDAVNLASRLEALCQNYGVNILLSETTWEAAEDEFLARPVDCVSVKGKDQPIVIYELLGPRAEASEALLRFAELTTRGFQHHRQREFGQAVEAYEQALQTRPNDQASALLLTRSQKYAASPPPDDWSGVTRMTSKSGDSLS